MRACVRAGYASFVITPPRASSFELPLGLAVSASEPFFATSSHIGDTLCAVQACKIRMTVPQATSAPSASLRVLAGEVMSCEGIFGSRAVVSIEDEGGVEFARGMVQLSSEQLAKGGGGEQAVINHNDYVILHTP